MNVFKKINFSGSFDQDGILAKTGISPDDSFMSSADHDFLLGLIEKKRPKKVLEVGIARGGSTLHILDWLVKLGLDDTKVYSVDIDTSPLTGSLIQKGKDWLPNYNNHKLYTGKIVPEVIEEIGPDVDFCVIDTYHLVPSELFDFIGVFPFLAKDAVVVLHDVGKNMRDKCRAEATKLLFDVVVADKYWNWDGEEYPNIAGFQINDDTKRYIMNVISALGMTWGYNPGSRILGAYGRFIRKYYSEEAFALYENLCKKNIDSLNQRSNKLKQIFADIICEISRKEKVYIYGAGNMAHEILRDTRLRQCISGVVVSDGQAHEDDVHGVKVVCISEVEELEDCLIINSLTRWEDRVEVERELRIRGIKETILNCLNSDQLNDLINLFDPLFYHA